ncbi:MAG: MarR family winged helix-turn-helix transcriptional regulator [Acetobacteraceae bacterium]
MPTDPLDLLHLLFDVARLLRAESGRRARARGLGRGEFAALAVLARVPGLTQRELAERLDVEPITVARLLDRLALRGLVERRPDPRDRRVWRLHLGRDAGALTAATAEELADLARHLAEGMDPRALEGVMSGLRHVAAALAAPAPERHALREVA